MLRKLVIKRSKWIRGGCDGISRLQNEYGNRCCLGFYGCQLGIRSNRLKNKGSPFMVKSSLWPKWLVDDCYNSYECSELIGINDDSFLPEFKREKRIAEIFKKHGVTVKFID